LGKAADAFSNSFETVEMKMRFPLPGFSEAAMGAA
jgi:hypothetical protein